MLPYAGFYAMRSGWKGDDLFLFFRAGPTGIGHIHEDMLEITLRAFGQNLLFDAGNYNYDSSEMRRYAIGTASHNTVIVDGKWQHRGDSKAITEPVHNPWVTTPLFDFVAATYDSGYQQSVYAKREYDPQQWTGTPDRSVTHARRVLFLKPYYALVLDSLDGTGQHTFDSHFHLDAPAARLDPATHAAFTQRPDNVQLALYPLAQDHLAVDVVQGQKDPLLGWYSNRNPSLNRPIPTVRFRKVQQAPALFATFLYPYRGAAPSFSAGPDVAPENGIWTRTLTTGAEEAAVAVTLDGTPHTLTLHGKLMGEARTAAALLVVRKPAHGNATYRGGWGVTQYQDAELSFTVSAPSSLVCVTAGGRVLFFNADTQPRTVTLTSPFQRQADLPAGAWTQVSDQGAVPAAVPDLFPPFAAP
jgi:hypothetical protein